jgi:orotate phosphoribosyltransferase-like protein
MPRVDENLIDHIIVLRNQGKTQEEIAVELRIVQSTVSVILRRNGLGGYLIKRGQKVNAGWWRAAGQEAFKDGTDDK